MGAEPDPAVDLTLQELGEVRDTLVGRRQPAHEGSGWRLKR